MTPGDLLDLSGTLLTLFGILISLFAVHLGSWLSKLQALRARWHMHAPRNADNEPVKREIRYAFVELYNWQPLVMTIILTIFGLAVVVFFDRHAVAGGVAFPLSFLILFNAFFAVMIALQLLLLVWGYRVGRDLKRLMAV